MGRSNALLEVAQRISPRSYPEDYESSSDMERAIVPRAP
jgi:hypothetical protein